MSKKMLATALAGVVLAQGCASWDQENKDGAATGALIGAGGGALIGAMTGSWFWGAVIGAGSGALAGYVIADNSHSHENAAKVSSRDRVEAVRCDQADREFKVAMESRDSASAEYHLKRSLELHPTPAAHNNLGLIELQQGRRDSARVSFRNAIALDPRYEPALQNLEKMGA